MTPTTLDASTVRPRRALRWTFLIGGVAVAGVIGLLTSQSFSFTPTQHGNTGLNAWVVSEYDAAPSQTTNEIVPSPVIETDAVFFYGTGDGSAGYYADQRLGR